MTIRRPLLLLALPAVLAACADARPPLAPEPTAEVAVEAAPPASLSAVAGNADVTYYTLHSTVRFYNAAIASVSAGSIDGNDAYVPPSASVRVTGNWQLGPVTDVSYCPFCIVQSYVAWVAPAPGVSPVNAGLFSMVIWPLNPNPGPAGSYDWTTQAPNADGEYHIGQGGTLDYYYQPWATAGLGFITGSSPAITAASYRIVVDGTPPDVTYSGALAYDIGDMVNVTCSATDATSGVASSTCANATGPAWSYGIGSHSLSATATDKVGNVGNGSATFVVTASYDATCALIQQWATNAGVANSMCAKLRAAANAQTAGGKAGPLNALLNELAAQSGKKMPADKAAILTAIVQAMLS